MADKTRIGRLALRVEGENWNAYYALNETMEDALPLGSIKMGAVMRNPAHKQAFMDLMREVVSDILEDATGHLDGGAVMATDRAVIVRHDSGCVDFVEHIKRQREWSRHTFGPGARTAGVLAHIRKELIEIESAPDDVIEWIDVIILAIDGAWRAGHSPETIATALIAKQRRNEARRWPDWRKADPNGPIEHDRSADPLNSAECVPWP